MFTYVTTISTVLFIIVWALIIIAYINYHRKILSYIKLYLINFPGGKYMGYAILVFFFLVFCLLFVNETTRNAIFLTPIWFILLGLMYLRYRQVAKNK